MPAKYTLEQVQAEFTNNGCELISTSYKNQLDKLIYTAQCGHINETIFKLFLKGGGVNCNKCAKGTHDYEKVLNAFTDKGCKLLLTEDELASNYKNSNCKLKYIASCGHENIVSYKNFFHLHP